MKKILIIAPLSTLDWGSKNAGGVDSVCQMLVKYLSQSPNDDFFYRVLAFDPFSSVKYSGDVIRLSTNVEVVVAPSKEALIGVRLPGFMTNSIRVRQQVSKFKPDIVHAHMSNWLLGVNKKHKRISTLHSYKKIGRKNRSGINNFIYETVSPFLSDFYVDEYTCVGTILQKEIQRNSIKPITVIGNPIDDTYFKNNKHSNSGTLKMVTCALISRKKRVIELVEIIKAINDKGFSIRLDVIGPYVDIAYKDELKKTIADLNMTGFVNMLGEKSQGEILKIYEKSNYGVFTSAQETFGLAPLEMLASGLPLISSKVGVLDEKSTFFNKIGTCFIDVTELNESVTNIIEFIKSNPSVNVERLRIEFSIESVCNKYSEIYKRLLN
ncbi:VpsD family glycosyltransferase [Shewanella frigidimarina]|uniref:VpsD family glycosyltransferase n=1 Tax=Shewanella frigidimarina TaxID=56812 RepID=UPI003D794B42